MIELDKGTVENLKNKSLDQYFVNFLSNDAERLSTSSRIDVDWKKFNASILEKFVIPYLTDDKSENLKLLRKYRLEDHHWNWTDKAMKLNREGYLWFSISINSYVQAMAVIFHPKKSRLSGSEIFYIDYIATAPWNRDSPANEKLYSGFGTILLRTACQYCVNNFGYCHAFSLHSLPDAEEYYRKIGMIDLGADDDKEGLRYFEMKEEICKKFAFSEGQ